MRSISKPAALCALAAALICSIARADDLDAGFKSPPDAARPWVFFFIMDGNQSREGITADFEAMKKVGVGGIILMEVDVGIPKGNVKFMSPEWRENFKFANEEAARLGLTITLPASPGWTGSGGPWVKAEQSMQKIVFSSTKIAGGRKFDDKLPQPPTVANFYRDIATLAFPTPKNPQSLVDLAEKTLAHRGHYSSEPGVKSILLPPATLPATSADSVVASAAIVDLTRQLEADGRLSWDAPAGEWTILRIGHTSTGANTRPAPEPGLGLECDKLDRAALEQHFDDFLGKLLADIGPLAGKSLVSLHIDSWEMGPQNWSKHFATEFKTRRGYDPTLYLPIVAGFVLDSAEISERFLWDLRQTVLELISDNHAGHLAELARRHNLGLSIEPYDGTPCDDMTYGSRADVPMCEFWRDTFRTWFSVAEATSIAHTTGRPIVAAEAFTSGDQERWLADPASLKTLGDWALCAGVNRFVFHRYAHQPWLDKQPGMTMGPYGIHFERTQTWWDFSPAWMTYLARCQFMLRQGKSVADILYLTPEASPQVFRPPASATRGEPPTRLGYNFDGVTPETLLKSAKVNEAGQIALGDGVTYRVMVLAETRRMTPALLTKVKELVQAGATIVGPPPVASPSLSDFPQCDERVRSLSNELWGSCDGKTVTEQAFGKGKVVWQDQSTIAVPSLAGAKWIWSTPDAAAAAPVGKQIFRRTITLPDDAKIRSARICFTADNGAELSVNDTSAGKWLDFHSAAMPDVAKLLHAGPNVITLTASNTGKTPNPAGLIAAMTIVLESGDTIEVVTDREWQAVDSSGRESAACELAGLGGGAWGDVHTPQREVYGDYAVVTDLLKGSKVRPDFAAANPLVRYGHRRTTDAEIYFVSSGNELEPIESECTFRVSGKTPELWDPLTGECRRLPSYATAGDWTRIPLRFEPAQSYFILFRKPASALPGPPNNFPRPVILRGLGRAWKVSFDPKWGGPAEVTFDELTDWTRRDEDGIRHYSGVATYHQTFDAPPLPPLQRKVFLDLGKVKNLAQVRLNGKDLGIVWCAPWRIEITGAMKTTGNKLEIDVVNLWPNRLIGDQSLPPEKRFTNTTWNPFTKDDALLESGLLGPVTIEASAGSARTSSK